ncbi:hypothetical protein WA588_000439, partial [Blastocystis sp. NMH]
STNLLLILAVASSVYLQNESQIAPRKKDYVVVNCGDFVSDCFANHIVTVRLYGHVSGIPSDLDLYHDVYLDNTCKGKRQTHMRFLSYVDGSLQGNTTYITGDVIYTQVFITFIESSYYRPWKCDKPLRTDVEYDLASFMCTDANGVDPLEHYRNITGGRETLSLSFTKDYLVHADHHFIRTDYEGCLNPPNTNMLIMLVSVITVVVVVVLVTVIILCSVSMKNKTPKESLIQ